MQTKEHDAFLFQQDISGIEMEMISLETDQELEDLKNALRLWFPIFCSNIVKILLFRDEEKLACLLTAYYELHVSKEMILCAIDNNNFQWLNYLWAFGKNYLGPRRLAK